MVPTKKGKNPENVADVIGTWPHVKKMVSRLYAVAAATTTDAYLDKLIPGSGLVRSRRLKGGDGKEGWMDMRVE